LSGFYIVFILLMHAIWTI